MEIDKIAVDMQYREGITGSRNLSKRGIDQLVDSSGHVETASRVLRSEPEKGLVTGQEEACKVLG